MNEKEFLQKIKEIKVIVPDEQFFLEYNSVVYSILKENQQLKEQLNKKYENVGTLTSEILYEENTKLVQENQQLKEQLERSKKARIAAIELVNKVINMRKNGYSYEQCKKYLYKILDIDKGE